MGKIHFLSAVCSLLFAVGCSKGDGPAPDAIWDSVNYKITFAVTDATGEIDLLDHAVVGNILGDQVKVIWNGKEFPIKTWDDEEWRSETRFNMPRKLALRLEQLRDGAWRGEVCAVVW